MKNTLTLLLALMLSLLASLPVQAINEQPQIIYLYSEVNEQQVYNIYLVDCGIDGKIVIDVRFLNGGTYSATIKCGWRITTPGTISIAWLDVVDSGESFGPLTPVAISAPQPISRLYLPLVTK